MKHTFVGQRRMLSCLLALALLLLSCPVSAVWASPVYSGYCGAPGNEKNVKWEFDEKSGTLTISGTGAMENWRHPTPYDDQLDPNAEMKSSPWYGNNWNTKVLHGVVKEGVTTLGDFAFSQCKNMVDVSLPQSVAEIGTGCMESCASLKAVKIPAKVKVIGIGAFFNDTALQTVELPDGLETILYGAFASCAVMEEIRIPDTVSQVKGTAFAFCSALKKVVLPEKVTSIGSGMFYACVALTSVKCMGDVVNISQQALAYCTAMRKFTIPDTCTSIASDAFSRDTNLTLYCYEGSYGQKFCEQTGRKHTVIHHDYQVKQIVPPTCTEQGYTLYYCEECERSRKEDVKSAIGHDYQPGEPVAPTCQAEGYTEMRCTHCADSYKIDPIPVIDHQWSEWSIAVLATPEADGKHVCSCTMCDLQKENIYPYHKLGDTDLDGVCTVYDIVLILRNLSGLATFDALALSAGDVNGNNRIDAQDSTLVAQHLSGVLSAYPIG